MRKNTGKVLSMILAMAMVVSSFSATFVSASTQEVVGNDARVDLNVDDDVVVVSDKYDELDLIADLNEAVDAKTMDYESLDEVEYVSFTKKSGDSLVKVVKVDDDTKKLVLKKNVSGTETIMINYKGTYIDDDTDKEVTARGSVEYKITAYAEGDVVLGKWVEDADTITEDPDSPELMAVNDSGAELALYLANHAEGSSAPVWTKVDPYLDVEETDKFGGYFDLSSDRNFITEDSEDSSVVTGYDERTQKINLLFKKNDTEGDNTYAKIFNTKLEVYAPKVEVNEKGANPVVDEDEEGNYKKGSKIRETVGVDKKWRVHNGAEIDKLGARTLIGVDGGALSFDSDDKYNDYKNDVKIITGYSIVVDSGNLTLNGGTVGAIKATNSADSVVDVENATVNGDIESKAGISVGEGAKVNGTLKKVTTGNDIVLEDGAVVSAIDAGDADLKLSGATVNGNVKVTNFISEDNDEYNTTISGDVTADTFDVVANDGSFEVKGSLIASEETEATYDFEGNNISVGAIDADYNAATVAFEESNMALNVANTFNTTFNLTNESDVTIMGVARVGSMDVEEDSILRFADTATVEDVSGEGMVVAQAGQFHIKSGISDVQLKLNGLAIGSTAFTADTDAVDENDFNPVGYSLTKEAASSTVDRFVVDAVSFAGLSFDKEFVTIAQGYSDTITLAAYPTGTNAPADARVMWELDGNDDAFNVVVDPNTNVATINVTAYNADDNTANNATIRAYLVDEDGYELEGYVAATCKVTAVAQPEIRGTLKADTTSYTLPVGGIYDIQFSVTGVDATPVVTDSRTGSVFQLTNLGNNKYRVTGVNEGTAYVVATVGDTRVSVAITVDNDATQGGEKGNNVSEIR